MPDKLEQFIKIVYKKWKADYTKAKEAHPDEETLACFLEGKLSGRQNQRIKAHLVACDDCMNSVAVQMQIEPAEVKNIPDELLNRVKALVTAPEKPAILEIYLRLKEKILEILNTTGDVLVGQELMPAPVLRSRKLKDFKDEVTVLKDFKDIRVEVKIENKLGQAFSLSVVVKKRDTQELIKDLRVALIKDDLELESYLTTSGKVIFEHVLLGKYTIEISTLDSKLASVLLDIKK